MDRCLAHSLPVRLAVFSFRLGQQSIAALAFGEYLMVIGADEDIGFPNGPSGRRLRQRTGDSRWRCAQKSCRGTHDVRSACD